MKKILPIVIALMLVLTACAISDREVEAEDNTPVPTLKTTASPTPEPTKAPTPTLTPTPTAKPLKEAELYPIDISYDELIQGIASSMQGYQEQYKDIMKDQIEFGDYLGQHNEVSKIDFTQLHKIFKSTVNNKEIFNVYLKKAYDKTLIVELGVQIDKDGNVYTIFASAFTRDEETYNRLTEFNSSYILAMLDALDATDILGKLVVFGEDATLDGRIYKISMYNANDKSLLVHNEKSVYPTTRYTTAY